MAMQMLPLPEDLKETILDEYPDGVWIVLEEEFPQSAQFGYFPFTGHPITVSAQPDGGCTPEP